jgi:hypothetical protein
MHQFSRVELNITYDCNLKCKGCNRICDKTRLYPDMSVEQVKEFTDKLRSEDRYTSRVKVVGGEPTVHPQFLEIIEVLSVACVEGRIGKVAVNTNGVTARQYVGMTLPPGISWKFSPPKKKRHRPFLWSPKDLCLLSHGPCKMTRVCGYSLDSKGWLPCSAAPAIVKMFDLEYLYKPFDGPLPEKPWGMEELCQDCIHGIDNFGNSGLSDMPAMWEMPSPRWADALWRHRLEMQRQ